MAVGYAVIEFASRKVLEAFENYEDAKTVAETYRILDNVETEVQPMYSIDDELAFA